MLLFSLHLTLFSLLLKTRRSSCRHFCLFIASWLVLAVTHNAYAQDNYQIKAFALEGINSVNEAELREALATQAPRWTHRILFWKKAPLFSSNDFQLDQRRILQFYRAKGFFRSRIAPPAILVNEEKQEVRLRLRITENEPARIGKVALLPADSASYDAALWPELQSRLALRLGEPLDEARVRGNRFALLGYLANRGFPFAKVEVESARDKTDQAAEVKFMIATGKWCAFGEVTILDTKKYPQRVIRKELAFKPKQRFDQSKLLESQRRIYRLELFQAVGVRALADKEQNGVIPIEIRVKEAPRHTVKLGGGFGTEERGRVSINFRRRNFLGDARRLQAEAKYSKLEPGRFQLTLYQPQFPEPKTALQLSPFLIRQKESGYEVERLGAELAAQRVWGKFSNGFMRYRFERVNADTSGVSALYRKSIFTLGLFRNSSAPLFSPKRGMFSALEADWSGLLFGADFQYLKGTLEARRYFEILPGVVFASRAKIGTIHPLSGRRPIAPPEERFYAGGSSSVRGWRRQKLGPKDGSDFPLGGNSLFESSAELRLPLWKALGAVSFVDAGNVWQSANTFPLADLFYAAGWGLRYDTPIGPARVDFAWKLKRQNEPEDKFEIHVSVGQAF